MDRPPPHEYPAAMPYPQQPYGYPPPPPPPPQQQQFHGGGATPPPQFLPPPPPPPPPPQFQYHQHHPPPPPAAHFHHAPGFSPHLPPPPPAAHFHHAPLEPPPADPELHKRIDKLVEYSAKNGPEFEAMIREKQKENPDYSFLFGGDGHVYYRHKLWLSLSPRPYAPPPFPPPPMPRHAPPPPMHHPQQPYFYDNGHGGCPQFFPPREYEQQQAFKGPLPGNVAAELAGVLAALNGTKESIKGAKFWFVQRSVFAPTLAEALRDRVFALDDSERQLHIIYLANDILFESMHRRTNDELDNEALAFKPVLGSMLARIYHHPHIQEDSQSKLQQLLQLWASNNIYDPETINALRHEMVGGQSAHSFPGPPKELSAGSVDSSTGLPQAPMHNLAQWHPDRQSAVPNLGDQEHPGKLAVPGKTMPPTVFPGSMPIPATVQPANQQPVPHLLPGQPTNIGEKAPPYPLFPPGLIPGMVRKMQIGSGVPYSPMSPLDIPTIIPPSSVSQSEILERVSKFFKEIGEVNPSEGPLKLDDRDDDDEYDKGYDREPAVRKGGACIPPPPNLQADPESGTYTDCTVERKPGFNSSGRLGLGATANPNEISQYDDVYTSYRKQRSTNYHSSMSTRATAR